MLRSTRFIPLIRIFPLVLGLAGCVTPSSEAPIFNQAELAIKERTLVLPTSAMELFNGDSAFIQAALRDFEATGKAPAIRRPGFVVYPYGEIYPILYCKPIRVCEIQLEPGETVDETGIALGDSERWIAGIAYSGKGRRKLPHILVKPRFVNISTNLVIMTSRRTYHVGLVSKDKDEYIRSAKFYYPRDAVKKWNSFIAEDAVPWVIDEERSSELPQIANLNDLNFDYEISGDSPRWKPLRAFDDRERTFIHMPKAMKSSEAPALFIKANGNSRQIVNYRVRGDFYIVDRLFEKAVLVAGVGRHQDKVEISRSSNGLLDWLRHRVF